ncbi:MAG: ribonucleotide-diphosphate reductase subunit beta [Patescibacteria group bacterium]|jgi:ribonucleoside-diphosphate reductase beta chain
MKKPVVSNSNVAETVWSYVTSVKTIRRSDGRIEDFDAAILEKSVRDAFVATGLNSEREHSRIQGVVQDTIHRLTQAFDGHTVPETQDVKELVGASLIDGDLLEVAKSYLTNDMGPKNTPAIQLQSVPTAKPASRPVIARRRRLSDERQSITHKFEIGSHTGYITVGLYEDGKPGEIFVTMSKEGSTLAGLLDALATSVSIGLQYGVPLKTLVSKFSHVRFEPSGFTQNPNIRVAKSVVDYIFRWLGTKFPDTELDLHPIEETESEAAIDTQAEERRSPMVGSCPMLTPRKVYKPFEYPQYFDYFMKQNQAHWMPTEIPMESDIIDYKNNLSPAEISLVINILRFFTQGDIEVNNNYNSRLIPTFPKPEIKMMLSAFAAMESTHVWAYSYLNDSLGLPEKEYSAFLDYESMRKKYEYIQSFDVRTVEDLAVNLAVFGGFMEGVSLFSSFAILMNFPRLGKLKGLGQVVTWSIRDETLHSKGVCQLFRDLVSENKHIWTTDLQETLYSACRDMVNLEDAFIDTCFSLGEVPGLKPDQVKQYIRYIADRRLNDLGLDAIYNVSNPLGWLDVMVNAKEHTNFFENRATEYSKGSVIDDWGA